MWARPSLAIAFSMARALSGKTTRDGMGNRLRHVARLVSQSSVNDTKSAGVSSPRRCFAAASDGRGDGLEILARKPHRNVRQQRSALF